MSLHIRHPYKVLVFSRGVVPTRWKENTLWKVTLVERGINPKF